MPRLNDVLAELHLAVAASVKDGNETLLLITRPGFKGFPPPPEQCYTLASITDDNPDISHQEAEGIRRHFNPPKKGGLTALGL